MHPAGCVRRTQRVENAAGIAIAPEMSENSTLPPQNAQRIRKSPEPAKTRRLDQRQAVNMGDFARTAGDPQRIAPDTDQGPGRVANDPARQPLRP